MSISAGLVSRMNYNDSIRNAQKISSERSSQVGGAMWGNSNGSSSSSSSSNSNDNSSSSSSSPSITQSSPPSSTSNFDSSSSLKNVFTDLGNIAETKAGNDQRRFREDLPFQSRIYQDFDGEAAKRTEGIDTRAREQNSSLTKDRMRLQSTQNMAEETNRGQVQVNTTRQTRDSDLSRALSVLPRR